MKYLFRALLPLAAVASVLVIGPGAAAAKQKASPKNLPVTRGSQYLALGDTITFGYMEAGVTPAPNYQNAASFVGYPEMVASALHLQVANAACPGETTSSFINPSAPSNSCENNPSGSSANYRSNFPLHVKYAGSQLAYAVHYLKTHHKVRLVSLMIGANDLLRCEETTSDQCSSLSEQFALAGTLQTNTVKILSAIRNQAHYQGQIAFVDYYATTYASQAVIQQTLKFEAIVNSVAKSFHAEIANGFGEFDAGSLHSGGDLCTAGLLTQLGGGKCGIHPSYAGQALLALAVEKAIKNA